MKHGMDAIILLLALMAGCTDGVAEKLDTAQLEEKQQNFEHARQLYQEIIRDHADSPQAKVASERLQAMPPP